MTEVFLRKSFLSLNLCRSWYGFHTGTALALYTSVEIVLMYRGVLLHAPSEFIPHTNVLTLVYALYDRTLHIRVLLIGLFLLEAATFTFASAYTMMTITFSPVCLVYKTPMVILPMRYLFKIRSSYYLGLTDLSLVPWQLLCSA